VAAQRIREALKSRQTDSMKQAYSPGATVLVYREDEKLWTGPYSVVQQNGKIVTVQRSSDAPTQGLNVSSVKPYYKNSRGDAVDNDEDAPLDRVMIIEILAPNDPPQFSNAFMKAKLQELEGLKKNGTWQEVWSHEVPKGAKKMTGRFVLTIKEKGTENEVLKARFVAQGYKDPAKYLVVHIAVLARQSSTRLVVSMSMTHGWELQSLDISKAYVQGETSSVTYTWLLQRNFTSRIVC
jgi:hypothetical protein